MQERYAVTVDLGTSVTSLAVSRLYDGNAEVVFYKEAESEGMRKSQVLNPLKCHGVLRSLINDAEETLGIKITQAVVGLPRYKVEQSVKIIKNDRSAPDSFITEEEVDNLTDMVKKQFSCREDESIYAGVVQSYSTDDTIQARRDDIIGATSTELEGQFRIFHGPRKPIQGIQKVFNSLQIGIADAVFVPSYQGHSVLTSEEIESGCALVEIGGGVTSVSIWKDSVLRYYASFPFGGKSLTTDIKTECAFQESLAENVKLAFGCCKPDALQSMAEKVLEISDPDSGKTQQLTVKYLSEIMHYRMLEIATTVMHLIHESGYADRLRNGIVLCGGAADTVGCAALFRELSGLDVRKGIPRPRNISTANCPEINEINTSAQITMISLCAGSAELNCCIDEPEVEEEEVVVVEENGQGKLFEDQEVQSAPEAIDPSKAKAEIKPAKVKVKKEKEHKRTNIFGNITGLVTSVIEDLFDQQETEQ